MSADLDTVPGGVIALSDDLRIVAANRAMGEMVGRDPNDLHGQPLDILLSAPSRILFQTHVYPALKAEGRVEEVFLTLSSADTDRIPVLLNAVRAPREDGSAYQALVVRILARARWEQDLLAATRDLERERSASARLAGDLAARHEEEQRNHQFRDAFIGVVSHELRTPITTIFGMSQVLRSRYGSMDPADIALRLEDIAEESDRLRQLTEDLLVLSRAEGRELVVATDPIVLGHLVRRVVEEERVRSGSHRFTVEMAGDVPLVWGEEVYVEQVLRNLLSNAVKYSPAGSAVRVTLSGETEGGAVRVIDQGRGLPDPSADRLFDVFYRAPDAARHTAGAGIGLFVCRELIHAMGGRIWASPAPPPSEQGAEFGVWLPAVTEQEPDHDVEVRPA